MAAELPSHRREQLVRVEPLAARGEPREQRGGEHSAGTPSSIAAIAVQRPSPESETRPANPSSAGDSWSAAAVRSSSHD